MKTADFPVLITGAADGLRKLRRLKRGIPALTSRVALAMLAPVETAAQAEVPRETGKLAAGIVRRPRRSPGTAEVGTAKATDYGAHVEFGTKGRRPDAYMIRAKNKGKKQAKAIALEMMRRGIARLLS